MLSNLYKLTGLVWLGFIAYKGYIIPNPTYTR